FTLHQSEVRYMFVSDKVIYDKINALKPELPFLEKIYTFNKLEGAAHWTELTEAGKKAPLAERVNEIRSTIKPSDMVTIIYTSGTTGNPKGVMLSHNNLVTNAIATSTAHEFGLGYRALSFLPLCHVYERMMNYHFQYKGTSIYYLENMGVIAETMREIKPHIANTVPRLLEKIYDNIINKGKNLPWLKKQIFFWAVNLGLRFRLTGNTKFYKFRLGIARRLVFNKWREALGGELGVMVSGGAALQS